MVLRGLGRSFSGSVLLLLGRGVCDGEFWNLFERSQRMLLLGRTDECVGDWRVVMDGVVGLLVRMKVFSWFATSIFYPTVRFYWGRSTFLS